MSKTKRPKTIIPKQSLYHNITTKEGDNLPTAQDLNMIMQRAARWPSAPRRSICDEFEESCPIMGGKTKRRKSRRKRKTKRRRKSRRKRKTKRRRRKR